ncbi:hypothetical protein ADEAN_000451700 [Angomonas deanei]|uniref:Uncharacterized protein n=1 Tax=Angomonas deanei TaxID=59799 RepID=A0A7G2CBZ6_9TRYP|nr:hypothetical protein ADEAN_000451700 [Angomonas deanei]
MSATDAHLYSRKEIISWVNEILSTNYSSFPEVPAKDMALILYGVYASHLNPEEGLRKVPLQAVQFSGSITPNVIQKNAGHVLSVIKALSAEEDADSGATSPIDLNLSVADWLAGKAFVQELNMWRWIRTKAVNWNCTVPEIEGVIKRYLSGGISLKRSREREMETSPANAAAPATTSEQQMSFSPLVKMVKEDNEKEGQLVADMHENLQRTKAAVAALEETRHISQEDQKENALPVGTSSTSCQECSSVVSCILKGNLNTIRSLEDKRKRALEACINKDVVSLLSALQDIV